MTLIDEYWNLAKTVNSPEFAEATIKFEKILEDAQKYLPVVRQKKTYPSYAIRGGNAGVLLNGCIVGNSNQSCPIKAFLRSWGVEENIDDRAKYTFAVGKAQEQVFAELHPDFKMGVIGESFEIEGVPTRAEIDAVSPEGVYYELKSVQSTSKLKQYFVEGEYSFDNLAQLAFYMAVYCQSKGVLRYTAAIYHDLECKKTKYKFRPGDFREFQVIFDDSGRFYVDNVATILTTDSVYRHIEYVAWVMTSLPKPSEILLPVSSKDPTKSVCCGYCPFKDVCEAARKEGWELMDLMKIAKEMVEA